MELYVLYIPKKLPATDKSVSVFPCVMFLPSSVIFLNSMFISVAELLPASPIRLVAARCVLSFVLSSFES